MGAGSLRVGNCHIIGVLACGIKSYLSPRPNDQLYYFEARACQVSFYAMWTAVHIARKQCRRGISWRR